MTMVTPLSSPSRRPSLFASVLIGVVATAGLLLVNWAIVPAVVLKIGHPYDAGPRQPVLSSTGDLAGDLVLSLTAALVFMTLASRRAAPHGFAIAAFMAFAGWGCYFVEVGFFSGMWHSQHPFWYEALSFVKYPVALVVSNAYVRACPTASAIRGRPKLTAYPVFAVLITCAILASMLLVIGSVVVGALGLLMDYPIWIRAWTRIGPVIAIPVGLAACTSVFWLPVPRHRLPSLAAGVPPLNSLRAWTGALAWLALAFGLVVAAVHNSTVGFGIELAGLNVQGLLFGALFCCCIAATLLAQRYSWAPGKTIIAAGSVVVIVAAGLVSLNFTSAGRLQRAIRSDDLAQVNHLLSTGVNPNSRLLGAMSPLAQAVAEGHYRIAESLLRAGADPAARVVVIDILEILLQSGPRCSPTLTRALLDAGRNPSAVLPFGQPPIVIALLSGANACAEVLLDAGADTRWANTNGMNSLNAAVMGASPELVERLLVAGVPVDSRTHRNVSPLMLAASRKHDNARTEIVRLLLLHGADPCLHDDSGRTAADYSARAGDAQVAHLIEAACGDRSAEH